MPRKDKNDAKVFRVLNSLDYTCTWENYSNIPEIKEILSEASKNGEGNEGVPDAIYENPDIKLLILAEVKPSISQHVSASGEINPQKYAVDGAKHYLSFFQAKEIRKAKIKEFIKNWKVVGLAISGDPDDEYNFRMSTYIIKDDRIEEQAGATNILNEFDYISLFENIDEEKLVNEISISSRKINKLLRSVDSQKRPVLLSALMICLFEMKGKTNDFRAGYNDWTVGNVIRNIPTTMEDILKNEGVSDSKIDIIKRELAFLPVEHDLNNTTIIKDILNELKDNIIPLFNRKSSYDIIGKFYEEFLRYAGVANVKKGIVLTPRHITALFTKLVDLKINDVVLDPACGTGAFLIAAMNRLMDVIDESDLVDKEERIAKIKTNQLIGFEKNATMFSLAISNMLFRGDGKSHVVYTDFFSDDADDEIESMKTNGIVPTIGFVNPPYGGKDNSENPTKKEIQFLIKMLDTCSRFGVIIAPLSTYFKENTVRNSILKKHTLKFVINMPKDLFMPNAATNTAIAVFETNKPHGTQEVVFYDLVDDGFVLSKSKGRTDAYNSWRKIEDELLTKLANPADFIDNTTVVKTKISKDDEWLIQAHAATDYSNLTPQSFEKAVKEYMVFSAKREFGMLDKDVDEIDLINFLTDYYA
jgi:type I restriction-modification system DNA methylase subunit